MLPAALHSIREVKSDTFIFEKIDALARSLDDDALLFIAVVQKRPVNGDESLHASVCHGRLAIV